MPAFIASNAGLANFALLIRSAVGFIMDEFALDGFDPAKGIIFIL
jgi:hypothetical protein